MTAGRSWARGLEFRSVLPYFRKLERDLNFSGEYHGKDGPITISRYPMEDWAGFVEASREAAGRARPADRAGPERQVARRRDAGDLDRREGSARLLRDGLSDAEGAPRPNLTIRTETYVRRILFEGTRAVGAEIARGNASETVRGREIMLTCGTIHSPAVLMRSGVGPPDELAKHGIPVVACGARRRAQSARASVVSISCYLNRDGRLWKLDRHHTQAHVRFSSRLPAVRPAT